MNGTGPERKTIAILFEIDQASGDGTTHRRRLAISSPVGRQLTTITDQIDGVLGHHQLADQSVLIFYVSGGVAKVIDYDIAGRATRSNVKLSATECRPRWQRRAARQQKNVGAPFPSQPKRSTRKIT